MSTAISRPESAAKHFENLNQALKGFDRVRADASEVPSILTLTPEMRMPAALAKHVTKSLHTRSNGIPDSFDNAWAWAAHWIKVNGVTLPPDTTEYRSLRNWFCYQVNMFKKNKLSEKSRALLTRHGIDLSLYRADNTGRGHRMNDDQLIQELLQHHAHHHTYDLNADSSADLKQWQTRLLDSYRAGGTSTRMRKIAAQLPGFVYGHWMRPGEVPIPSTQYGWWSRAAEFRIATQDCPAFRGRIDLATPAHLREWASEQIGLAAKRQLSPRQRGEMMTLNLLSRTHHQLSQQKSLALSKARNSDNVTQLFGKRERDVKTFLGATLLAHLLRSNAELTTVYSTLSVPPAQFAKMRDELAALMPQIESLSTKTNLHLLRKIYRNYHDRFESMKRVSELPSTAFEGMRTSQARRIEQLAGVILQLRDSMRRINVRQDLVRCDVVHSH